MPDQVFTTGNANVQAFTNATAYAQARAQAAEQERAATEAARLALPTQVQAITAPAVNEANAAAAAARVAAGLAGSVSTEAELAGKPAGQYRVGLTLGTWTGNAYINATPILGTAQDVQDAQASLRRISVDATLYGVAEGASAQTLLDAINATPDGGTLVCPRVTLKHTTTRLYITGRKNLLIEGNGLVIEALTTLPDGSDYGGVYLLNCEDVEIRDVTYDGRLDVRPIAVQGDGSTINLKSGWNVLNGCKRVKLVNVRGNRCMMDGLYVGHGNATTDHIADHNTNFPLDTVLDNCGGDLNYRQGISWVGVDGLTINGGQWTRTGMLGDGKWTSPAAGMDGEGFIQLGVVNTRVIVRAPHATGNRGMGISIHNGSIGTLVENPHCEGNGGEGIGLTWSGHTNTVRGGYVGKNYVLATTGRAEIAVSGEHQTVEGVTIECEDGVAAIVATGTPPGDSVPLPTRERRIRGNTIRALGSTGGQVFVAGGTGDTVENNVLVNVVAPGGAPAVEVDSPGGRVVGNQIRHETGSVAQQPLRVTTGYATGNTSSGYTTPAYIDALGEPPLPPDTVTMTLAAGRAGTLSGVTATLLSSTPNTRRYRVRGNVLRGEGAETSYVIDVTANNGRAGGAFAAGAIVAVNAVDPGDGTIYKTVFGLANPVRCAVEAGYSVDVSIDVEYSRG